MTTQTDRELLPCPFCGWKAALENFVVDAVVRCQKCKASICRKHARYQDTGIDDAITAWNTRAAAAIGAKA